MSRGGLCQAAPAAPSTPRPGRYGRMGRLSATAGRLSRFADMLPDVRLCGVVVRSEVLPTSRKDSLPKPSWTDREQVPSADSH